MRSYERQIAAAQDQLAGDVAHLNGLRLKLRKTAEVIGRGQRAYEESVELLARVKSIGNNPR